MYRSDSNASFESTIVTIAEPRPALDARPSRYRARDFGIGYGTSSGYAAARRYAPGSQPAPRFRFS